MIAVFGLGFVGLTTALAFAEKGFTVKAYDVNNARMDLIRSKQLPFHEPGLDDALIRHLNNRMFLTNSIEEAIADADVAFFCVGTPADKTGAADLTILTSAIRDTLKDADHDRFRVIVVKSTVPPGSTDQVVAPLLAQLGYTIGQNIGLANNPEFLREGSAWQDAFNTDRIVVGAQDERSAEAMTSIYSRFDAPVHVVSYNTGEFIKYLSNTLHATLISFANDMSQIADLIGGIEVTRAFNILQSDGRWSGDPCFMATHYVHPGCGFGGYCLPKDTSALLAAGRARGYNSPMLDATLTINNSRKTYVAKHIAKRATSGKPIGILGLSFKNGSDDVRQSPSRDIIAQLLAEGYRILGFDPIANRAFKEAYPELEIDYASSAKEIIEQCDTVAILTAWDEFREYKNLPSVVDYRYMR